MFSRSALKEMPENSPTSIEVLQTERHTEHRRASQGKENERLKVLSTDPT